MGMAAGQARLLSITARLSDNEQSAQALAFSKQRLADETEQINNAYLKALDATKLQVLTGFNGSSAIYSDLSYNLLTGYNTVSCGRQYVVNNQKGEILVPKEYADAYENKKNNGDFNLFLAAVVVNNKEGFTIADIDVNSKSTDESRCNEAKQKIHEAWDAYYKSVGKSFYTEEHGPEDPGITFGWQKNGDYAPFNGYAYVTTYTYDEDGGVESTATMPLNFDGITQEQRELYDYAVSLTEAYYNTDSSDESSITKLNNIMQDPENSSIISYLKNIFNQMRTFGYYTENSEKLRDNSWFEEQIRQGKLGMKYFSSDKNTFMPTTLSDDNVIQEVEDEKAIALVEAKYTQDTAALESKDKKIDLELKKLDSEHNALQTEYESVKNVIDKNVEKSFNAFS